MKMQIISWYNQRNIWLCRIIVTSLFLSVSSIAFILFLLFLSNWLVYESPLQHADIILIDQTGQQLDTAVDLFRQGYTPAFLIHTEVPEKYMPVSDFDPLGDVLQSRLIEKGIPFESMYRLRSPSKDFFNNRELLYQWLVENNKNSIIFLTSDLNSRKEKMVAGRLGNDQNIQSVIIPLDSTRPIRLRLVDLENAFVSYLYIWLFCN